MPHLGIASSSITHLPPRRFFEVMTERHEVGGKPDPRRIARLWFIKLGDRLEAERRMVGWSTAIPNPGGGPHIPGVVTGGLRNALMAAADG